MNWVIRVSKKRTIYLPKEVMVKLGLKVGDKLVLEVIEGKIILTPIKLKKADKYWREASVSEIEEIGEEITRKIS